MNLGIKWLWKNNEKVKVDKIKNDLTKLQNKVETNTANIVNLENTKATKSYVDEAVTFTGVGVNNIPPNTRHSYALPSNSRPLLVTLYPSAQFFTNWTYDANTQNLTIINNTNSTQSFSIYIIVKRV